MLAPIKNGLFVIWTGKVAAGAWDRKAYNVKLEHGLGWTPYRIRFTDGAISYTACHTARELRQWLKNTGYVVKLIRYGQGVRLGRIVAK